MFLLRQHIINFMSPNFNENGSSPSNPPKYRMHNTMHIFMHPSDVSSLCCWCAGFPGARALKIISVNLGWIRFTGPGAGCRDYTANLKIRFCVSGIPPSVYWNSNKMIRNSSLEITTVCECDENFHALFQSVCYIYLGTYI